MNFNFSKGWTWTNLYLIPTINIFIMDGVDISLQFLGGYITLELWREQ